MFLGIHNEFFLRIMSQLNRKFGITHDMIINVSRMLFTTKQILAELSFSHIGAYSYIIKIKSTLKLFAAI